MATHAERIIADCDRQVHGGARCIDLRKCKRILDEIGGDRSLPRGHQLAAYDVSNAVRRKIRESCDAGGVGRLRKKKCPCAAKRRR